MRQKLCLSLTLLATVLSASSLGAQQVLGRVTDQQSGQPIAQVQVYIVGPTGAPAQGGLSQQNGRYLLLNVPPGTYTVTAQRIGFRTQTQQITVTAGQPAQLDFALSEEALGLDEIIVTGTPGGTQRRAIGNSVVSVQASEVTQVQAMPTVQSLLTGRAPGLQLSRVSGVIGAGSEIEVRGIGTFTLGRNPLIFVDGVRVNNASDAGPSTGNTRQVNVLNDFNPNDIESIEVIKGPSAATLYGTEASAGVIQIITKRGAQGAPEFTASIRAGTNFLKNPQGIIGTKWTCRSRFDPPCEGDDLVPYNAVEAADHALDDGTFNKFWSHEYWPQENLFQNGPSQNLNLGVRGGTETIRYYLSGNYSYDEGPLYYNTDEALRLRANVGVVFGANFSLDLSTGYVDGSTRLSAAAPGEGGEWDDMGWGNGYCTPIVNPSNPCSRLLGFQEHLPTDIAKISATRDYQRFTGSATLNFTYGEWLTSRATLGLDQGWDENQVLHPMETEQTSVYQRTQRGEIRIERPQQTEMTLDWSATATRNLTPAFNTATSVGVQYYERVSNSLTNIGAGFPSPLSTTVNQTPVSSAQILYSYIENKTLGFFVQEQLGWNNRLFLTGALRFDDNSAFGAELSPDAYPKVSGTWVVSEESFWNVGLINSLRLRAAWGQAGRQPDTFAGVNTFSVTTGPGGTSALNPSSSGNPLVGPERSTELELGFDYSLLSDRVSGEFSWYNRKTEDALLGVPLPPSMGAGGNVQKNIGRIDNWGWEATANTRIYESSRISIGVDLSASHTDNEVKELGEFPGSNSIRIGWQYPVQTETTRFVEHAEYDPDGWIVDAWGRRIAAYCDQGVVVGGGDPEVRNGQYGVVRGGDLVPCNAPGIGSYPVSAGPAFFTYRFSVSPSVSLMNNALRIHVLADGAYGKIGLDGTQEWGHRYNNSFDSRCECDPTWVAGDRYGSMSTWGNFDADFWKLREVGVRYNLPESLTRRFGAERAAVSLSGRELAVLWRAQSEIGLVRSSNPGLNIIDPEIGDINSGNNANHRIFPPLTSLLFGLEVTF